MRTQTMTELTGRKARKEENKGYRQEDNVVHVREDPGVKRECVPSRCAMCEAEKIKKKTHQTKRRLVAKKTWNRPLEQAL